MLRVARTQVTCDVVARGVVHAAQETCITIINIQPVEDIMHAGFRGLSRGRFLSGRVGIFFKNNDTYRRVVNKGGDDNGPGFPPLATNGSEADSISKRHDPGIQ